MGQHFLSHALAAPSGLSGMIIDTTNGWSLATLLGFMLAALIAYATWIVYFHPLSAFPGPKRAIISNIFYFKAVVSGRSNKIVKAMHDKYGDVVRWGPNELSFATADAWKDIYERRKNGVTLIKDPIFYRTDDTYRAKHIVNTHEPEEHAQQRKMMSHAFSTKALLTQEDVILRFADDLNKAIKERGPLTPINLVEFFNWTTFDVLGELAFGESFQSLQNRKTDEWISIILDSIKFNAWDVAIYKVPILPWFQSWITPKAITTGGVKHAIESKAKILRRSREQTDRKDFVSYILARREELMLTDWQLAAHANALIVAGSETSTTTLSGLFYYLMKNKSSYMRLKQEIRSAFKSLDDIDSKKVEQLPYMTACLEETFRIYPPIPIAMPRLTPPGGCEIAGRWVPGRTTVGVHMWSITHNPAYFKEPDVFRPERWLEKKERLDASKPFLTGPRMCMGINMAWIELRIIAAKLVFEFDFEIMDKSMDWNQENQCFTLWQKPDLYVYATAAKR